MGLTGPTENFWVPYNLRFIELCIDELISEVVQYELKDMSLKGQLD